MVSEQPYHPCNDECTQFSLERLQLANSFYLTHMHRYKYALGECDAMVREDTTMVRVKKRSEMEKRKGDKLEKKMEKCCFLYIFCRQRRTTMAAEEGTVPAMSF